MATPDEFGSDKVVLYGPDGQPLDVDALFNGGWRLATKEVTFTGLTAAGLQDSPVPLFIVTGVIEYRLAQRCTETLVPSAATTVGLETFTGGHRVVNVNSDPGVESIETGHWSNMQLGDSNRQADWDGWETSNPSSGITAEDFFMQPNGGDVDDGTIVSYLEWKPWSSDGNVAAA